MQNTDVVRYFLLTYVNFKSLIAFYLVSSMHRVYIRQQTNPTASVFRVDLACFLKMTLTGFQEDSVF